MRRNAKKIRNTVKRLLLMTVLPVLYLSFSALFAMTVTAGAPTDEIEHFLITVDVQEDASLLMNYHIDWKVLDDKTYGPLTWVDIGLPNKHHSGVTAKGRPPRGISAGPVR